MNKILRAELDAIEHFAMLERIWDKHQSRLRQEYEAGERCAAHDITDEEHPSNEMDRYGRR